MDNSETGLLSINVTPAGAATIKRILGITRWTFILGILFTCLNIASILLHDSYSDPEKYVSIKPLYWQLKYHDWYFGIYTIVFIFQLYTYLQFARNCYRAVDTLDVDQFNGSFTFLYRFGVLALIGTGLGILLGILDVWANMAMANLAHGRG